jgi:hypothetical protein
LDSVDTATKMGSLFKPLLIDVNIVAIAAVVYFTLFAARSVSFSNGDRYRFTLAWPLVWCTLEHLEA